MKASNKTIHTTVIFLTTKKGQEKGTKDIYMVNQDGEVSDGIKGVECIHFNTGIPVGISAKNAITCTLFMNPINIIVDPFHAITVLEADELGEIDKEALSDILSDFADLPTDSRETHGTLSDIIDTISNIKGMTTEISKGFAGNISEMIKDVAMNPNNVPNSAPVASEASEAPKSALEVMEEMKQLVQSGNFSAKKFRELIPEASFLEFSKKLSDETNDDFFYKAAKYLEANKK